MLASYIVKKYFCTLAILMASLSFLSATESSCLEPAHAAILGLTEGATEFLPISSSAHLILISRILGLDSIQDPSFQQGLTHFLVIIQFGAILAVFITLKKRVASILQGLFKGNPEGLNLTKSLCIAFVPTGIIGFLLEDYIEKYLHSWQTMVIGLVLGACFMFCIRVKKTNKTICSLSSYNALFIGLMQSVALCPGVSRSMVTIAAGLLLGLSCLEALEFSFLLGFLTIGAASCYKLFSQWHILVELLSWKAVFLGTSFAFLVSLLSAKVFFWAFPKYGFTPFAWYRIFLASFFVLAYTLRA